MSQIWSGAVAHPPTANDSRWLGADRQLGRPCSRCPTHCGHLLIERYGRALPVGRKRSTALSSVSPNPIDGALDASEVPVLQPSDPRYPTRTVTRRNVAGIDAAAWSLLVFWLANSVSSSCFSASLRPFFSAASKAFIVGP